MLIDRRLFLSFATVATAALAFAFDDAPRGRVETIARLGPDSLAEPRVRVWLPPRYAETERACRTHYMLDGQFAFAGDSEGVNFAVDRRVARLIASGSIGPTLIVAINNLGEDRFLQYMPQTIYDRADGDIRATI